MKDNTNLTFTLQGISEHNGKIDVIDTSQENVEAIIAFTFKQKGDDAHSFGISAVGGFSLKYYMEIIQQLMQTIGRDKFMKALVLSEISSKFDKTEENWGADS